MSDKVIKDKQCSCGKEIPIDGEGDFCSIECAQQFALKWFAENPKDATFKEIQHPFEGIRVTKLEEKGKQK